MRVRTVLAVRLSGPTYPPRPFVRVASGLGLLTLRNRLARSTAVAAFFNARSAR